MGTRAARPQRALQREELCNTINSLTNRASAQPALDVGKAFLRDHPTLRCSERTSRLMRSQPKADRIALCTRVMK